MANEMSPQSLRHSALDLAIQHKRYVHSDDDTIVLARKFEKYLAGEAETKDAAATTDGEWTTFVLAGNVGGRAFHPNMTAALFEAETRFRAGATEVVIRRPK